MKPALKRYLRLYGALVRFSWSRAFEFRFDFWLRVLMDLVFYAVNIVFFEILYLHAPTFGGLAKWQALIFVATYLVVDGVRMTFFVNNFWMLRQMVAHGDFDFYLTKPASPLFLVTCREFSPASLVNLTVALGILIYTFLQAPVEFSFSELACYIFLVLNGIALTYLLQLFFAITVFWTQSPEGIEGVLYILKRFAERPHTIYHPVARFILLTLIPLGLVASAPALSLFLEDRANLAVLAGLISLSLVICGRIAWRSALRNYTSASS